MQAVTITQITPPELESLIENIIRRFFLVRQQPSPSPPEAEQFLNIQQTAKFLQLAVPTIYGMVSHGTIPCMKRGKKLYFLQAELAAYLKQGRKKTNAVIEAETDEFLNRKREKNGGAKR